MSSKTKTNRNRTLLIILGILLAFLLTLNASSFYSAEIIPSKEIELKPSESPTKLHGKASAKGLHFIKIFAEKFTSLK